MYVCTDVCRHEYAGRRRGVQRRKEKKISRPLQSTTEPHTNEREVSQEEEGKEEKEATTDCCTEDAYFFVSSATDTQKRETRQGGNGELRYDKAKERGRGRGKP
jgi:hypothetical protein